MRGPETPFTHNFRRALYISGSFLSIQAAGEALYQLSEGNIKNAVNWTIIGAGEAIMSKVFFQSNIDNPLTTMTSEALSQEEGPMTELQGSQTLFLETPEAHQ